MTAEITTVSMAPAATRPWLLPASAGAGVGSSLRRTPFDQHTLNLLAQAAARSSVVQNALAKFLGYVLKGGITITGRSPMSTHEVDLSNPEVARYLDLELNPLLREMAAQWLLYGFACVRVVPSLKMPGWPTAVLLRHRDLDMYVEWDEYDRSSHRLYSRRPNASSGGAAGAQIPFSSILCMYEPDENGRPTSPISSCLYRILQIEKLQELHMQASQHPANPPVVFTQKGTATQTLARGGLETTETVSELFAGVAAGRTFAREDALRHDLERREAEASITDEHRQRQFDAWKRQQELIDRTSASALASGAVDTIFRVTDPLTNRLVTPPGQDLARPLVFGHPPDLVALLERHEKMINETVGLPSAFGNRVSDNAASVELTNRVLLESVRGFQERARPLIAELVALIFAADLLEMVVKNQEGSQHPESDRETALALRRERGRVTSLFHVPPPSLAMQDPEAGVGPAAFSPEERDAALEALAKDINIDVSFVFSPFMTLPMADHLFATGVVHEQGYQDLCFKITGLPDEYRRKDFAAWHKKQQALELGGVSKAKRSSPTPGPSENTLSSTKKSRPS